MMTYYRLALQNRQTATWTWKSTVLTSLHALLQLLRVYSFVPQDRVRVFTSASKEDLDQMLSRENDNLASGSVTAAQFLHARGLHVHETAQGTAGNREKTTRQLTSVATYPACYENSAATGHAGESAMSSLDKRRLEIERGTGGDHDTPYLFSLPISTPQLLAWTKLLTRVQREELQP